MPRATRSARQTRSNSRVAWSSSRTWASYSFQIRRFSASNDGAGLDSSSDMMPFEREPHQSACHEQSFMRPLKVHVPAPLGRNTGAVSAARGTSTRVTEARGPTRNRSCARGSAPGSLSPDHRPRITVPGSLHFPSFAHRQIMTVRSSPLSVTRADRRPHLSHFRSSATLLIAMLILSPRCDFTTSDYLYYVRSRLSQRGSAACRAD